MLKINSLKKIYKNNLGIENINLEIEDGEIFGFIGPNGAGKSTTIKCILDFLKPNNGEITLQNNKNYSKEEIGYLPSEVNLYEDLTVLEMIKYNNSFYKKDGMKKAKKLVKKLELNEKIKISELSLGNKKKLGLILTIMHEPKLIILDEPTSGLDPLMQEIFFELLLEEKKKGHSIFFSSHNLNEVKKICDKVAIIKNGKIIEVDEVSSLTNNNVYNITIKTTDKFENFCTEDGLIKFTYDKDINDLLKKLTKIKIEYINIEEPTLEEIFMHFYKEA